MIQVIDYKAGNLTSVVKTLHYLNAQTSITQDPDLIRTASKIVLPGVGHFAATQLLHDLHITEAIREAIARGAWFLGVCVGLQWLFAGSTESPATPGLGHFPGQCERFPESFANQPLKSPHVGWNSLESLAPTSKLLANIDEGGFVYYTHSWRAPVIAATAATTPYGGNFTAAVERDNVMGVQFHPEKSSTVGLQLLKNFVEL
jgi:glutamine amidotransferase